MSITTQEVRRRIDLDEIDYPALAAELGAEALPHLQVLAEGRDAMLASKATYLASLIGGEQSVRILETAIRRPEPEVRIAAASGVRNLRVTDAEPFVDRLLEDGDVGVRKVTVRSMIAFNSPAMNARIRKLSEQDPEPLIRDLANRNLAEE